MKRQTIYNIMWIFSAAALLGSCTKGDAEPAGPNDPTQKSVQVSFTARMDHAMTEPGGSAASSAAQDPAALTRVPGSAEGVPVRVVAQAVPISDTAEKGRVIEAEPIDDNLYAVQFDLNPELEYDILFWADDDVNSAVPNDLTAINYRVPSLAYAARKSGRPTEIDTDVTLKHVVAKVTLVTDEQVTEQLKGQFSLRSCSRYNVQTMTPDMPGPELVDMNITEVPVEPGNELFSFYYLPDPAATSITLTVNGRSREIETGPVAPNTHLTLKGDPSLPQSDTSATGFGGYGSVGLGD